jgi:hypothetical protein
MILFSGWILLFLKTFFVFAVAFLVLPLRKEHLLLDKRLFFSLFTVSIFLTCDLLSNSTYLWSIGPSLFSNCLIVVGLLCFAMTFVGKSNDSSIDYTFVFTVWYCGLLGVGIGFSAYLYVVILVFFVFSVKLVWTFLSAYGLETSEKTLVISAENSLVFDRVMLLFDILGVTVLDKHVERSGSFYLTLRYRSSDITQHVLLKHLLNRSDLNQIISK